MILPRTRASPSSLANFASAAAVSDPSTRSAGLITILLDHCDQQEDIGKRKELTRIIITLPPRERVEIQLDNPEVTLVEEERIVPLAKGLNDVVFAWANASIDKDSIQFRCLTDPEHIRVLSVSYPPGENALTWQVWSPKAGSARVRISYLIGRLDMAYRRGMEKVAELERGGPEAYMSMLYYDTVTVNPRSLRLLLDLAGPEHVLLGSDWVWAAMSGGLMDAVGHVDLDQADQDRICRQNALDLFKA